MFLFHRVKSNRVRKVGRFWPPTSRKMFRDGREPEWRAIKVLVHRITEERLKSWACIIWWRGGQRQLKSSLWLNDQELQWHQNKTLPSGDRRVQEGAMAARWMFSLAIRKQNAHLEHRGAWVQVALRAGGNPIPGGFWALTTKYTLTCYSTDHSLALEWDGWSTGPL